MSGTLPVEVLSSVADADARDLARLVAQLSKTATFDRSRVEAMIALTRRSSWSCETAGGSSAPPPS